ncbi:DUF1648 domain-containing protein [Anaerotignum sp.]|uniref:DUF1648 domain-containing protein n=1 Tax=Anaerotignum sp. TaxID=2039241 RepID=UPI002A912EEC|nr:DUF1648 domain-containing protein [Anaerotignum sp.]MCI7658039.1 DUF1648 domain-containing protein [Clostridia bacterium]MDY5416309.1 DUF1648 domain-containing protein [Anaerotignum sp.]
MKIPRSPYDVLVNVVGICSLGGTTLWLLTVWNRISDHIPVHYDLRGHVDRMAGKDSLWVLLAVSWVMFLALSVVERFPQIWNTGVQVTEKNQEKVYRTLKNMLGTLKMIIAVLFSYLAFQSAFSGNLPPQFLPVFLLVTFGSLAFFLVRLIRLK